MQRIFPLLALVSCLAAFVSCRDDDPSMGPPTEVDEVVISRDSLFLEVGASTWLRAEARGRDGLPVQGRGVEWSSRAPGVATVSGAGEVRGIAGGSTWIIAQSGGHADSAFVTVPMPITSTTILPKFDTITALAAERIYKATSSTAEGPRIGRYSALSLDTTVVAASYDPHVDIIRVRTTGTGATHVVVAESGGTRDSAWVVVKQRPISLHIEPDLVSGTPGWTTVVTAVILDSTGHRIPGIDVTWTSTDTSMAAVTQSGSVEFRRFGRARIKAAIAEGLNAEATVIVDSIPRLAISFDRIEVGAGMSIDAAVTATGEPLQPYVRLAVDDTTVALVPDSIFLEGGGGFPIHGKRDGKAIIVATAPGARPDTAEVTVLPSRIEILENFEKLLTPGSSAIYDVTLVNSKGWHHRWTQPVAVELRSTDTAVLSIPVEDRELTLPAGEPTKVQASVDGVGPGKAAIYAVADGFGSDTLPFLVAASPKLRFLGNRPYSTGVGLSGAPFAGLITSSAGYEHDAIPVTFTRTNATVATFPSGITIPDLALSTSFDFVGLAPGTDTITASAPGYQADTVVLVVTPPKLLLPDTLRGTIDGVTPWPFLGDTFGLRHTPTDEVVLWTTSSDTTVAGNTTTRIPAHWNAPWPIIMSPIDTGTAVLTVTDSAGRLPSHTIHLTYEPSHELKFLRQPSDGPPLSVGARQIIDPYDEVILLFNTLPVQRTIYLTSSDPDVLTVPDSLAGTYLGYIPITGGDSVGSSTIRARARGYLDAVSPQIDVGRPRIDLEAPDSAYVGKTGYNFRIRLRDHQGFERKAAEPVDITVVGLDPGVVLETSTVSIPANEHSLGVYGVEFSTEGSIRLAAVDPRSARFAYVPDTAVVHVRYPPLSFPQRQSDRSLTLGRGQSAEILVTRPQNYVDNALGITIESVNGRVSTPGLLGLAAGQYSTVFHVGGRTIGMDKLVASAIGYDSASWAVEVTDGHFVLDGWQSTLKPGAKIFVSIETADAYGTPHPVEKTTVFHVTTTGSITVSDDFVVVSSGSSKSATFIVTAGASGSGSITVMNLDYVTKTAAVSISP